VSRKFKFSGVKICSQNLAQAALFSLQGVNVGPIDRIIAVSPGQTMQDIGILNAQRMNETDRTIFEIMLEKQFSGLQKPRGY